jgi:hypothetical protein
MRTSGSPAVDGACAVGENKLPAAGKRYRRFHLKQLHGAGYTSGAEFVHFVGAVTPHLAPHSTQQHGQLAPTAAEFPVAGAHDVRKSGSEEGRACIPAAA